MQRVRLGLLYPRIEHLSNKGLLGQGIGWLVRDEPESIDDHTPTAFHQISKMIILHVMWDGEEDLRVKKLLEICSPPCGLRLSELHCPMLTLSGSHLSHNEPMPRLSVISPDEAAEGVDAGILCVNTPRARILHRPEIERLCSVM